MTEAQLFIGVFLLVAAVCALIVAKSGPTSAICSVCHQPLTIDHECPADDKPFPTPTWVHRWGNCGPAAAKSGRPANGPDYDDPDNGVIDPGSWLVVHWDDPRTKWVTHVKTEAEAWQMTPILYRAGRHYEIHGPDDDDDDSDLDDDPAATPLVVVTDDPEADLLSSEFGRAVHALHRLDPEADLPTHEHGEPVGVVVCPQCGNWPPHREWCLPCHGSGRILAARQTELDGTHC